MKNLSILLLLTLLLTSCGKVVNNDIETTQVDKEVKTDDLSVNKTWNEEITQVNTSQNTDNIIVAKMLTSHWDITLELYPDKVPKTVANFVIHAQNNYYDWITFHRIINGFMIQWWDPLGTGQWGKSIYWDKFDDEFDSTLSNTPGTISMANSGPNTNGSQFFINQWNNTNLDYNKSPLSSKHAVFGLVIDGMDVVEKIALVPWNPATGKPNDTVVINDIELYKQVNGKLETYIIDDLEQAKQDAILKNKDISEEKELELSNKVAKNWDLVGVKYNLTLEDGSQIDSNFDSATSFDFTIGQEWIITGFSNAVKGMKIWDRKTVTLSPSEWYGEHDDSITQSVPMSELQTFIDAGVKLEAWNVLPTPQGEIMILSVTETEVIIDANHPLAGKNLNFEIELNYFVN